MKRKCEITESKKAEYQRSNAEVAPWFRRRRLRRGRPSQRPEVHVFRRRTHFGREMMAGESHDSGWRRRRVLLISSGCVESPSLTTMLG